MMQIKSLMLAAACAFVLPVFAADADKSIDKTDKAKSEVKADVKKPVAPRAKVAGDVVAPEVKKDSVEIVNGQTTVQPYTLRNERWVPKEDRS